MKYERSLNLICFASQSKELVNLTLDLAFEDNPNSELGSLIYLSSLL